MKNLGVFLVVGGLMSFANIGNVTAQIKLPEVEIYGTTDKAEVSEKVTKSFDSLFKGASAPSWSTYNKQMIVNFILNDQRNKAAFEKNGRLVYHLIFGTEKQMPADVRTTVKSKYFDYSINSTLNVNTEGKSVWIVNIWDPKEIMVLKVQDGVMNVMDRFFNRTGDTGLKVAANSL